MPTGDNVGCSHRCAIHGPQQVIRLGLPPNLSGDEVVEALKHWTPGSVPTLPPIPHVDDLDTKGGGLSERAKRRLIRKGLAWR